jgi:hypothetical protein
MLLSGGGVCCVAVAAVGICCCGTFVASITTARARHFLRHWHCCNQYGRRFRRFLFSRHGQCNRSRPLLLLLLRLMLMMIVHTFVGGSKFQKVEIKAGVAMLPMLFLVS